MITRTEFLEVAGLGLDLQFTVIEDVNNKMEIVEGVKVVLLNGINIVNIISDDFKAELVEQYYKAIS
tara:strand:+ start:496 stop:696 length:201 start_codon:yes stop_codon:yes gene_type:complete